MSSPVELMAETQPDVVRLAETVSLAARVEPFLLRRARLRLLAELDAGTEADLWFSPLVQSRGPGGIVLLASACDELRSRLARDPALLAEAHELVSEAHAGSPPTICLEEDVIWHSVTATNVDAVAIEHELQRVVATMRRDESRSRNLARWALHAAPRLPAMTHGLEAVRMLNVAARTRLDPTAVVPELDDPRAGSWLAGVLPESFGRSAVGVRLLEAGVELSSPPAEGAHTIEVPGTNPLVVEVKAAGSSLPARSVAVPRGGTVIARPARIRVVDLRKREERAAVDADHLPALVALSPSGDVVAAVDADGELRTWSLDSGEVQTKLTTARRPTALAISEGGEPIAVAAGGVLRLYGIDGTLIGPVVSREVVALTFELGVGGRLFGLRRDGTAWIWDVGLRSGLRDRGRLEQSVAVPDAACFAVLADDVLVGDTQGRIVSTGQSKSHRVAVPAGGGVAAIAVEGRGRGRRLVRLSRDGVVEAFDLRTGRARPSLELSPAPILALSAAGTVAALAALPDRIELRTDVDLYTLTRASPEAARAVADPERELDALTRAVPGGLVIGLGERLDSAAEGLAESVHEFAVGLTLLTAARSLPAPTLLAFGDENRLRKALGDARVDFVVVTGDEEQLSSRVGRATTLVVRRPWVAKPPRPPAGVVAERLRSAHLLSLGCDPPTRDSPSNAVLEAMGPDVRATALVLTSRVNEAASWANRGVAAVDVPAAEFLASLKRRVAALPRWTGDDWALVIGVGSYRSDIPDLAGAVRDARAFSDWLIADDAAGVPGAQVIALLDPTRNAILEAVARLETRRPAAGGRLYVYFAGHSMQAPYGGIPRDVLLPADFDLRSGTNAIDAGSLLDSVRPGFADQFVFIDASRDRPDSISVLPLVLPSPVQDDRSPAQQFVLHGTSTGGAAYERVQGDQIGGMFTAALMDALRGRGAAKAWSSEANRYEVRWRGLVEYVSHELERQALSGAGVPTQRSETSIDRAERDPDPVVASFARGAFPPVMLRVVVSPAAAASSAEVSVHDELGNAVATAPPASGPFEFELEPGLYSVRAHVPGVEGRREVPIALYEPVETAIELGFEDAALPTTRSSA